ncbi:MAG: hypothetical protein ABJ311_13050 [Erythrobacter sp.]
MERANRKLDVDLCAASRIGVHMDNENRTLIIELSTRAAMPMEDESVAALTIGTLSDEGKRKALVRLQKQTEAMHCLIKAT